MGRLFRRTSIVLALAIAALQAASARAAELVDFLLVLAAYRARPDMTLTGAASVVALAGYLAGSLAI